MGFDHCGEAAHVCGGASASPLPALTFDEKIEVTGEEFDLGSSLGTVTVSLSLHLSGSVNTDNCEMEAAVSENGSLKVDYTGISFGSWNNLFSFSVEANLPSAVATYDSGVLSVTADGGFLGGKLSFQHDANCDLAKDWESYCDLSDFEFTIPQSVQSKIDNLLGVFPKLKDLQGVGKTKLNVLLDSLGSKIKADKFPVVKALSFNSFQTMNATTSGASNGTDGNHPEMPGSGDDAPATTKSSAHMYSVLPSTVVGVMALC